MPDNEVQYRGRLAPSPTGYLHFGHAFAFYQAAMRVQKHKGVLIYRDEDLDLNRCKKIYSRAAMQNLKDLGLRWQEGPDTGGPYGPYIQSERKDIYKTYLHRLIQSDLIYPCLLSRKEIKTATTKYAPNGEAIFPIELRSRAGLATDQNKILNQPESVNWRFRVPNHKYILFHDQNLGSCKYKSLDDFGDFLVWRKDGMPSYELAVVIDDAMMHITEIVRGADLLVSTARQLLLYDALQIQMPAFYHCPVINDAKGRKLSKRDGDCGLDSMLKKHGARFIIKSIKTGRLPEIV